jgi:uncharacterized protein (DUF924 family)
MPFMHSESRDIQARSVALFRRLGVAEQIGYAEHHKATIERFGDLRRSVDAASTNFSEY